MDKQAVSVILVDPEQGWLDFCCDILERNGYIVHTATSTKYVEEFLASGKEKNREIVLIDVYALEHDSASVSNLVQASSNSNRSIVAIFPAELTPSKARAAFKLGVSDCVNKPYDEVSLLALVEGVVAELQPSRYQVETPEHLSGNVLIVEDDPDWRVNLVKYLPAVNHITTADDYHSALEEISKSYYDLIIVDLKLTDVDGDNFQGIDLIRFVREKDKERRRLTQIIVVSAFGTTEYIRELFRAHNVYHYFDKRYLSPSEYRALITEVLVL